MKPFFVGARSISRQDEKLTFCQDVYKSAFSPCVLETNSHVDAFAFFERCIVFKYDYISSYDIISLDFFVVVTSNHIDIGMSISHTGVPLPWVVEV